MPSNNKNIIGNLRRRYEPHMQLSAKVDLNHVIIHEVEKKLLDLPKIHKTLSKSFAMQRKTLTKVLGLEKRVNVLELEQAAEEQAQEGIDEILSDLGEEAQEGDVIIPEVLQGDAEVGGDDKSNVMTLDGEKKPPFKVNRRIIKVEDLKRGTSQESLENIQANNEVTDLAITEPRPDVNPKVITPEVLPPEEGVSQSPVGESPVGEGLKNILNSIAGTTESIKNILIGQQKADSDAAKDAAKDAEASARAGQEKKLESKVFKGVKKVGEKVLKPVQGIFEKIWGFLKKVLLADIVRRLFNWLSDDGNKKKVGSIFKFVQNFWPLLLTGFLLFGTGIGSLITGTVSAIAGFIPTLLGLIPGLVAFLASPIGLAVLGTAAVVGGGMWIANKMKGDDKDKKIESSEPVKMNKGGSVPGKGNTDTVPAMLTPGEFVLTKEATQKYGTDTLESMNAAAATGKDETSGIGRGVGSAVGGLAGGVVGFFADSPVSPVADIALGMAGSAAGGEIGDNVERKVRGMNKGGVVQYFKDGGQAKENKKENESKLTSEELVAAAGPSLKIFMDNHNELLESNPEFFNQNLKLHMDRDGKMPDFGRTVANMSEYAFNEVVRMTQESEAIEPEVKEALLKEMAWIRKGTLEDPNFKGDLAFHVNKDIPGTAADRLMMRAQADTRSPAAKAGFSVEERAKLMNRNEKWKIKEGRNMNKGGLVQHFNKGGLVQYLKTGGRVLSTKQNATLQGGQVTSGNMSQSNAEKAQQRLKLEKHLMIQRSIHGYNSPEANEIRKKILILQGTPAEAIYTDRKGNLKIKGYSTYSGKKRRSISNKSQKNPPNFLQPQGYDSNDPRSKRGKSGFGRLIGGAADMLTGNLFDFDNRSGGGLLRKVVGGAADAITGNRWDFDNQGKPAQVAKSKPKHTEIAPPSTSSKGSSSKPGVTAINAGSVGNPIDATQKTPPPEVPHFTATLYRSNDKIKTLGIMV